MLQQKYPRPFRGGKEFFAVSQDNTRETHYPWGATRKRQLTFAWRFSQIKTLKTCSSGKRNKLLWQFSRGTNMTEQIQCARIPTRQYWQPKWSIISDQKRAFTSFKYKLNIQKNSSCLWPPSPFFETDMFNNTRSSAVLFSRPASYRENCNPHYLLWILHNRQTDKPTERTNSCETNQNSERTEKTPNLIFFLLSTG